MKRRHYKYIFYFNCLFIIICTVFVFMQNSTDKVLLPVSVTNPVINTSSISSNFCTNAKAAIILDAKSGAVLFEKNRNIRLPMASTTKVMTALVVIENSNPDDIITVSKKSASTEGSSIYLKEGEKISVIDLLYGMLLESGNDAANALAEGCFGSIEACCSKMNEKAHDLGLIDTHFESPSGLDSENHYTTAHELAIISSAAMKNHLFRTIVSTEQHTTSTGEKARFFSNHNRLLRTFEGAVGIKTGYTSKSGRCLVSCAAKDGEEYIAVTLHDSADWQDHKDMLSFAFGHYDSCEIAEKDTFLIHCGFDKYLPVEDIYITTHGQNDFTIGYKITFDKSSAYAEFYCADTKSGNFGLTKSDFSK